MDFSGAANSREGKEVRVRVHGELDVPGPNEGALTLHISTHVWFAKPPMGGWKIDEELEYLSRGGLLESERERTAKRQSGREIGARVVAIEEAVTAIIV